ncbi:MAG TPA: hypothetical protein PKY29_10100 [Ferruginibacter sp.]|nr:hypothetical protein [Ferruginibacter sp.]HRO17763.1 hypothetical protein [Ferruginibacter sp.]HRQ21658.1 hypothetical protein [Ferruginibacter sp.]
MYWVRYPVFQKNIIQKSREPIFRSALIEACTTLDTEVLHQYFNRCAPHKIREALVRLSDFFDYLWKLHPEDWWVRPVHRKNGAGDQSHTLHFEVYAGNQSVPYAHFSISYQYNFSGQFDDLFISHYFILSDTLLMQNEPLISMG